MSRILTYRKSVGALASLDGEVTLPEPLRTRPNSTHSMQVIRAIIPSSLCNIYDARALMTIPAAERIVNSLVRMTNDGGATWTTVQMHDGAYSVAQMQNAINDAIGTWHKDPADPAFVMRVNAVLRTVYIILDSTKLNIGAQIGVDFTAGGVSLLSEVLGFITPAEFLVDGTFAADQWAFVDWFGDSIDIGVDGLGYLSLINGSSSNVAVSVSLNVSAAGNSIVYPGSTGEKTFTVPCKIPGDTLQRYRVEFRGRGGRRVLAFGNADVELTFQIFESGGR